VADIVLTTLNARYAHAAFGLRYLMANLGELRPRARILEFDVGRRPVDVVEAVLAERPAIVGFGVYIWNVAPVSHVVSLLKRVHPDVRVVLGGPEATHSPRMRPVIRRGDFVIHGEADLAFADLCRGLLAGRPPLEKHILAPPPSFDRLELPYDLYTDEDIQQRVVYVEASRGCPFLCEFCLSSLDDGVRHAPLDRFLGAMQSLLDRGLHHFKFVDRTFNLNVRIGRAILEFFADRYRPGMLLHFEMIPDRLPEALREHIRRFPPGSLQFEVGIQTFNERVATLISRRQDNSKAEENLRFLRSQTGVHVHADLIVGLPGEDLESFAAGFDRLVGLRPQEIQVGMLKRLHGTPIVRHDREWGMVYDARPPYEILQTRLIDFQSMQRLRRFARYWDLVANSGNFVETTPLIWRESSPFRSFLAFSDWLYGRARRTHAIALPRLAELVFEYLTTERRHDPLDVARALGRDYRGAGRRDVPMFLRAWADDRENMVPAAPNDIALPRQARHGSRARTTGSPEER
jgi:radical SAM superfamily enzyme YgiQ (UPF0313 family)